MVIVSKKIGQRLRAMIEIVNNGFIKINALNSADIHQCLDLLTKSFPSNSYYDLHKKMNFFVQNEPELKCLVLKENDECIGIQCIVGRALNYFGISCRAIVLSYTAIKPSHQNSDAIDIIKKNMFNYINNNSDLSLGFARKVMDNYWYPYGYRGVTNFCEISLSLKPIGLSKTKVNSKLIKSEDIPLIDEYYNNTHREMLGPFQRSNELWECYLKKIKKISLKLFVMDLDKKPIGYYILNDNVVLEVGYNLSFSKQVFKHIICKLKGLGYDNVIFKIGKEHPLNTVITQYEHSINTRFVWRGGHIVRITSVKGFLNNILNVLEIRAQNSNLSDFDFSCNSYRFSFSKNKLSITSNNRNKSNIIFDEFEWTKLIYGACRLKLLNGYVGDKNENILRILFPICSPQFLEIDQV